MDVKYSDKKLLCIEYPGIVHNVDNMLKTLGGVNSISQVCSESSRRLEVRFRPDDIFCKCFYGDRYNTTNLLMKVVRRRKKGEQSNVGIISRVEIMGVIDTTYKFRGMADYQYLPVSKTRDGVYESLLPQLIPSGLQLSSWYQEDAPLCIQPPLFSRLDQPSNYNFRKEPIHRNLEPFEAKSKHPPNIVGRGRRKRTAYALLLNFEDGEIPSKPLEAALAQIQAKRVDLNFVESLKKVFESRPLWSKNALLGLLGDERARLKVALPLVSYYFLTGPWRSCWVRWGFDPRKEPSAKTYQILDFRIHRKFISDKFMRQTFRRPVHNYKLPTKMMTPPPRIALIHTQSLTQTEATNEEDTQDKGDDKNESQDLTYIFKMGCLPAYRQTFYHLCDIQLDAVQQLVHSNDGQEDVCREKDGWCLPGTLEKFREILYHDVTKTMEKKSKNVTGSEDTHSAEDSDDAGEDVDEDLFSSDDAEENMETD